MKIKLKRRKCPECGKSYVKICWRCELKRKMLPRGADPDYGWGPSVLPPLRRKDCQHYRACYECAVKLNVSWFSCEGCLGFRPKEVQHADAEDNPGVFH